MTDANTLVKQAIKHYQANDKAKAKELLLQAVDLDERNEQAWMWMSAVVESLDEQQICLENVLALNPNNERAKKGLAVVNQKLGKSETEDSPPQESVSSLQPSEPDDPFQDTNPASDPWAADSGDDPWGALSNDAGSDNPWGGDATSDPWGMESTTEDVSPFSSGDDDPWGSDAPSSGNPFGTSDAPADSSDPWGVGTSEADPWGSTSSSGDPFGSGTDVGEPSSDVPAPANPFVSSPEQPSPQDEFRSSVDWGDSNAGAVHGSGQDVEQPTGNQYDNWIGGLELDQSDQVQEQFGTNEYVPPEEPQQQQEEESSFAYSFDTPSNDTTSFDTPQSDAAAEDELAMFEDVADESDEESPFADFGSMDFDSTSPFPSTNGETMIEGASEFYQYIPEDIQESVSGSSVGLWVGVVLLLVLNVVAVVGLVVA